MPQTAWNFKRISNSNGMNMAGTIFPKSYTEISSCFYHKHSWTMSWHLVKMLSHMWLKYSRLLVTTFCCDSSDHSGTFYGWNNTSILEVKVPQNVNIVTTWGLVCLQSLRNSLQLWVFSGLTVDMLGQDEQSLNPEQTEEEKKRRREEEVEEGVSVQMKDPSETTGGLGGETGLVRTRADGWSSVIASGLQGGTSQHATGGRNNTLSRAPITV